nr:tetratricopeptide repeat protein [Orientia tsutsugamushi]
MQYNPNDAEAYHAKGISLDELGQYQEAIENYDLLLSINQILH